jgi:hypothetical protein
MSFKMSSKDDKEPKTAAGIYEAAMGDANIAPDYIQFITYALKKKNQDLVVCILNNGKEFEGPNAQKQVMKMLETHLEKEQSKNKEGKWVERIRQKDLKTKDLIPTK